MEGDRERVGESYMEELARGSWKGSVHSTFHLEHFSSFLRLLSSTPEIIIIPVIVDSSANGALSWKTYDFSR